MFMKINHARIPAQRMAAHTRLHLAAKSEQVQTYLPSRKDLPCFRLIPVHHGPVARRPSGVAAQACAAAASFASQC